MEKEYKIIEGIKEGIDFNLIMFKLYGKFEDKDLKSSTQRIYNFPDGSNVITTWDKDDVNLKKLPIITIDSDRPESMMWTIEDDAEKIRVKLKLEEISTPKTL